MLIQMVRGCELESGRPKAAHSRNIVLHFNKHDNTISTRLSLEKYSCIPLLFYKITHQNNKRVIYANYQDLGCYNPQFAMV